MFSVRFQPEQIPLFLPDAAALCDVISHLSSVTVTVQRGKVPVWFGKANGIKDGRQDAAEPGRSVFTKGEIQLHAENK